MIPRQIYRVYWQGGSVTQHGDVYGSFGRVYTAKVFSSEWGDPNWAGAAQLIIRGDFTSYQPRSGALFPSKVPANNLAVVSIARQQIEPQTYWPSPWKDGGQYEIGDYMPGQLW